MAQWLTNPTRTMKLQVQSLVWLSGLRIWHRPAATAPIRPLAWDPPYATGVALEKKKKEKPH